MKASPVTTIPRAKAWMQFQATRIHSEEVQVDYELVLPLDEVDCRGTFENKAQKRPKSWRSVWLDKDNCKRIPLGRCMVGTSNPAYPFYPEGGDTINTPFRDGAHCQWDGKKMGGLDIYYITTDGKKYLLTPEPKI